MIHPRLIELDPEDFALAAVPSHDLFAVGDCVVVTKDGAMTKGKGAIIERWKSGKWKVEFSPQWCGYYLPSEISHANASVEASPTKDDE